MHVYKCNYGANATFFRWKREKEIARDVWIEQQQQQQQIIWGYKTVDESEKRSKGHKTTTNCVPINASHTLYDVLIVYFSLLSIFWKNIWYLVCMMADAVTRKSLFYLTFEIGLHIFRTLGTVSFVGECVSV